MEKKYKISCQQKKTTVSILDINMTLFPLLLGKLLLKFLLFKHSIPSSVNFACMVGAGTKVEMETVAYSVCKELQQFQNILPSFSSLRYLTMLG